MFKYYATAAGCGEGTVQEQLACLRRAPISALTVAQDSATRTTVYDLILCLLMGNHSRFPSSSGYVRFIPVVDGKTILDFPTRLITEGKMAKIPLIVGWDSHPPLHLFDLNPVSTARRRTKHWALGAL